jgi:hypothetical protein
VKTATGSCHQVSSCLLPGLRSPNFVSVWVCVGALEFGDDHNSAPIANIATANKIPNKTSGKRKRSFISIPQSPFRKMSALKRLLHRNCNRASAGDAVPRLPAALPFSPAMSPPGSIRQVRIL